MGAPQHLVWLPGMDGWGGVVLPAVNGPAVLGSIMVWKHVLAARAAKLPLLGETGFVEHFMCKMPAGARWVFACAILNSG